MSEQVFSSNPDDAQNSVSPDELREYINNRIPTPDDLELVNNGLVEVIRSLRKRRLSDVSSSFAWLSHGLVELNDDEFELQEAGFIE